MKLLFGTLRRELLAGWAGKVFGGIFTFGGALSVIGLVANNNIDPTIKWIIFGITVTALVLRVFWVCAAIAERKRLGGDAVARAAGLREGAELLRSLRKSLSGQGEFDEWMTQRLRKVAELIDPDKQHHPAIVVWREDGRRYAVGWHHDPRDMIGKIDVTTLGHVGAVWGNGRSERVDDPLAKFEGADNRGDLWQLSQLSFTGIASAAVRFEKRTVAVVSVLTRDGQPGAYEEAAVIALANAVSAAWRIRELEQAQATASPS
ncbi:hypothetical protein [Solirubrobacter soli]|uniref:hypothetical protein n=1 Tax=Solirubrobacter soli TaxID=363832 RepID=UPI000418B07D|nr:hypothetical protein [Solirubrobacter soli]